MLRERSSETQTQTQLACKMFKFITVQLERLKKYVLFGRTAKSNIFSLERRQHSLGQLRFFWTMSFAQMRPKWARLTKIHSTTFRKTPKQHISNNTSYQRLCTVLKEWSCWLEHLAVIKSTMDSSAYQSISNVSPSLWQLKLGPIKVQNLKRLKCCGRTLRELWMNDHKPQWTKAMLERRGAQNSSTTMWKTELLIQNNDYFKLLLLMVIAPATESCSEKFTSRQKKTVHLLITVLNCWMPVWQITRPSQEQHRDC